MRGGNCLGKVRSEGLKKGRCGWARELEGGGGVPGKGQSWVSRRKRIGKASLDLS